MQRQDRFPNPARRLAALAVALAVAPVGVQAAEFLLGEAKVSVSGALTLGTAVRTEARDPGLLPNANSSQIGIAGTAPGGRNQDDGNLNFAKGDAVSTVFKGFVDVRAQQRNLGAFARIKVWHDFVLADEGMPWGHSPNAYAAGQPLSEAGLPRRARFSGAVVEDAYVQGDFAAAGTPLHLKLGRQTLPWGKGFVIGGGVAELNPVDAPAMRRPGALAEEMQIAFPALYARLDASPQAAAEFFAQIGFEPSALPACGTFYSASDFVSPGCDRIWVSGANDRAASGFRTRAADPAVADGGQYGVAFSYGVESLATTFGATAAQYHSRMPYVNVIKGATPLVAQYAVEHPERIRLFALEFLTRLRAATIRGAVTYRPNQPVQLNATDLLVAFGTAGAGLLRAAADATPTGAIYPGYDRLKTMQAQLAANLRTGRMLGAAAVVLGGEIGIKRVDGLPDVNQRRYGRPDVFGAGPLPGAACTGAGETCSNNGFVTSSSWGYRLRAELSYPGAIENVELKPGLAFGHDVRGWSADGGFSEGRKLTTLSLRGEVGKRYFADLAWQRSWGGVYDNARDRDAASLAVGLRF